MKTGRRWHGTLAALAAGLWLLVMALPAGALEAREGRLPDGTLWRVVKPDGWNGTLLLDLDYAGRPPEIDRGLTPFKEWALARGYAFGGTQREPVGYDFHRAVEHLVAVHDAFAAAWGRPTRTLAIGNSRGAFVARLALERRPEIFHGALVSSGGGGGSIAGLNSKLDGMFALKTLVDPGSTLELVGITDLGAATAATDALVRKALETPAGRARLALAAAFEQYDGWTVRDRPRPADDDYEAQLDQIGATFAFANPALVRAGVEKVGGGNVSWNHGVDYARLLQRSGQAERVKALYRRARLDLREDLRRLARAPRIAADPAAVARAEQVTTYSGRISAPVVVVDNFDPVDSAPSKLAYAATLRRAGTADLLRVLWSERAGHSSTTPLERAVGLTLLVRRLDTGRWADTAPRATNALALELATDAPAGMGDARFFEHVPPAPLRSWDASNWGTYAPPPARDAKRDVPARAHGP